jgi:hypothetical protein
MIAKESFQLYKWFSEIFLYLHQNANLKFKVYHRISYYQENIQARCQWLTPAIPATQEAMIRRMAVQSQTRQIACKTLS